jgi:hypothetical protein
MKFFKLKWALLAVILISFTAQSNNKEKKITGKLDVSKLLNTSLYPDQQKTDRSKLLVASYLQLKNALVSDDAKEAAIAAEVMVRAFKGFNTSGFNADQQKEIAEIIENASEQVEHIADNASRIEHQREHFEVLSNDMSDLIAIVGSEQTLYQTKCPMYNKGKGGIWLSETKDIKNPFYGSKMLTCGSVQKEI